MPKKSQNKEVAPKDFFYQFVTEKNDAQLFKIVPF